MERESLPRPSENAGSAPEPPQQAPTRGATPSARPFLAAPVAPSALLAAVQPKLEVGAAGDAYEQEADETARQVVSRLALMRQAPGVGDGVTARPSRIRRAMGLTTPLPPRGGVAPPRIRRATGMAGNGMVGADGGTLDDHAERAITSAGSGGAALQPVVRRTMEEAFGGVDFSRVRLHTGRKSQQLNETIQAKAFTHGSNIFFRDGAPDVSRASGQELIAHELTHTLQQTGDTGRKVAPLRRLLDGEEPANHAHEWTDLDDEANEAENEDGQQTKDAEPDSMTPSDEPSTEPSTGSSVQRTVAPSLVVGRGGRARRNAMIHRTFRPSRVVSNAHLRDPADWNTFKGPTISKNSVILANSESSVRQRTPGNQVVLKKGREVRWMPAVSIGPDYRQGIPAERQGYIRQERVQTVEPTLGPAYKRRITAILRSAEALYPNLLTNVLVQEGVAHYDKQLEFFVINNIRLNKWDGNVVESFAEAFSSTEAKFTRIKEGADYLAKTLDHWQTELHPTRKGEVRIASLKYMQSDLHERGLGVVKVKFDKPLGGGTPFDTDEHPEVMIKPEDKSLELALLGAQPGSAVNKINKIVGLTTPDEQLTSIKMCSDEEYGAMIEAVKATSAEDLAKLGGPTGPTAKAFHETLVFALLAGLDDLHKENVFWDAQGRPFLIDADNVLIHNQMLNKENGKRIQTGFGGAETDYYDNTSAVANKNAIETGDNTGVDSKILDAMLYDDDKRRQIIEALKIALDSKRGRVVPMRTAKWGDKVGEYPGSQDKEKLLDDASDPDFLVRETTGFDEDFGPGLFGTAGKNLAGAGYQRDKERAELKADFEKGVIPFYEYEFTTGWVRHNDERVYDGLTLDQALNLIVQKFDRHKADRAKLVVVATPPPSDTTGTGTL